jgi:hypothetical protein
VNVRQLSRIGGVALAAVAAVTMLAACGGGSPKAAASTSSPSASGANASIQAYISCLGKNGVTIAFPSRSPGTGARPSGRPTGARPSRSPGAGFGGGFTGGGGGGGAFGGGIFNDPSNPPTGVSATAWTSALAACKSLAPTFNRGGAGGAAGGGAAYQAYLTCLKSHGVTASAAPRSQSTADPKVAAAMKTCAPLRPTGRPTNAPSPTN